MQSWRKLVSSVLQQHALAQYHAENQHACRRMFEWHCCLWLAQRVMSRRGCQRAAVLDNAHSQGAHQVASSCCFHGSNKASASMTCCCSSTIVSPTERASFMVSCLQTKPVDICTLKVEEKEAVQRNN